MSPYRRNVMVGATVLTALLALGWMILKFAGAPIAWLIAPRMQIHFVVDRADGLSEGSNVIYRGVNIGQITRVTRTNDDRVRIDAAVPPDPPLPANIKGVIRSTGLLGGGSAMVLTLIGDKPEGQLKRESQLEANYVGLDLLPPEFAELAGELRLTARQFRESNVVLHMDEQVQHLGKVIDSLQTYIDDPKIRTDLQESIANLRKTTEKADQIGDNLNKPPTEPRGHMDDLSKNIGDRLTQVAGLLDQLQQVTRKVNEGKGTAGALVNDPKLYESLVDTTQQLNETIKDLRRLAKQWEQEGISFKMGK